MKNNEPNRLPLYYKDKYLGLVEEKPGLYRVFTYAILPNALRSKKAARQKTVYWKKTMIETDRLIYKVQFRKTK